jgi:hypothetical protein
MMTHSQHLTLEVDSRGRQDFGLRIPLGVARQHDARLATGETEDDRVVVDVIIRADEVFLRRIEHVGPGPVAEVDHLAANRLTKRDPALPDSLKEVAIRLGWMRDRRVEDHADAEVLHHRDQSVQMVRVGMSEHQDIDAVDALPSQERLDELVPDVARSFRSAVHQHRAAGGSADEGTVTLPHAEKRGGELAGHRRPQRLLPDPGGQDGQNRHQQVCSIQRFLRLHLSASFEVRYFGTHIPMPPTAPRSRRA